MQWHSKKARNNTIAGNSVLSVYHFYSEYSKASKFCFTYPVISPPSIEFPDIFCSYFSRSHIPICPNVIGETLGVLSGRSSCSCLPHLLIVEGLTSDICYYVVLVNDQLSGFAFEFRIKMSSFHWCTCVVCKQRDDLPSPSRQKQLQP